MCVCNYASTKIYLLKFQLCNYESMEIFMCKRIKVYKCAGMHIFKCVGIPLCMYASMQIGNKVSMNFSSAKNLTILQVGQ